MRDCSIKSPLLILLLLFLTETPVNSQPTSQMAYEMDFRISTFLKSGESHMTEAHITRLEDLIRFEPKPPGGELHIFDYGNKIFYRIFPKEKIFFTHPISQMEIARAYQQGIIFDAQASPLQVKKIKLVQTEIQGHPSILYLIGKEITLNFPGREKKAITHYSFVWEAQDLFNMPIKIADRTKDGTTTIIEFLNIEKIKVDSSLFSPPQDYLHLSPF